MGGVWPVVSTVTVVSRMEAAQGVPVSNYDKLEVFQTWIIWAVYSQPGRLLR